MHQMSKLKKYFFFNGSPNLENPFFTVYYYIIVNHILISGMKFWKVILLNIFISFVLRLIQNFENVTKIWPGDEGNQNF